MASYFPDTPWDLVFALRDQSVEADRALEELCGLYRQPLVEYIRACAGFPADAEDLAHDFLILVLNRQIFQLADQPRGKLRSFLLSALKHFLSNAARDANALKRGGGKIVSLDHFEETALFADLKLPPDLMFDRSWARKVIEMTFDQLRAFYSTRGKGEIFEGFRDYLLAGGGSERGLLAQAAKDLGISHEHAKASFFRMRKRFLLMLRRQVEITLSAHEDLDEEVQYLVVLLGGEL